MSENMTREELKAQVVQYLACRQRILREERRKYDAETEALFPVIHRNHKESIKNV